MASGSLDSIHVLHVDDDLDFADMAGTFLEREDDRFDVETAAAPSEAVDRLDGTRFDCIVSDYDMPRTSGIEFLEHVREEWPDLPFILFTGKGSEEVASEAISVGVTDYLQKKSGTDQYALLANRINNAVERRKAEQERNRQLEAIETAREGISILDEDGHYIYVNQRFADLHGYDPAELIGQHWELAYRDEDIPDVREDILPEFEREGYWHGETTSLRADGSTVTLDHTLSLTERGELVCTVRDISDQKEREQELQQKTARLEALFENSPDMINVHDTSGEILEPNPRLCEKTGYDASELAAMTVWELDQAISPDTARALWEDMEIGENRLLDGEYERADGSTFPVEIHLSRLRFDGQDRFVAIARDITDRKERERELEEYQTIVETAPDPIAVVDTDGRFQYVNPALCDLTGYDEETLRGQHVSQVKSDAEVAQTEEAFDRLMRADETTTVRSEALLQTAGDEPLICEDHMAALQDGDAPRGAVIIHRDITERVRREEELKRQQDRLDEFASVVRHDLRNPLRTVEGRLELAVETGDVTHVEPAMTAIDRMEELIADVAEVMQSGAIVDDDREEVDIGELTEAVWDTTAAGGAASLRIAESPRVVGDPDALRRMLDNLLGNVVEHGDEDITVRVGELDDGFYIEDDGPGIPEDEREDIFEPGYSTKESGDGTGLGMTSVQQIVRAHGWEIDVTEGTEGGARFEITGGEFSAE